MKKKYSKPEVIIEKFELTEHIASCGDTTVAEGNAFGKPNHYGAANCEFILNGGTTMFTGTNQDCYIETDPDNMDVGCYNTPDGVISIFAS